LFCSTGFELRALHLLGRHYTTWATPPALLTLGHFLDRISLFCLRLLGLDPPTCGFPHSWNHRQGPPRCLLKWSLPNFLPWLASYHCPSSPCLWSNWVYSISHHVGPLFLHSSALVGCVFLGTYPFF
jgi:hypothetical protein